VCFVSSNHSRSSTSSIPWALQSRSICADCAVDSWRGATTGSLKEWTRPSTHSSNLIRSVFVTTSGVPSPFAVTEALEAVSMSANIAEKKRLHILPDSSSRDSSISFQDGTSSIDHMSASAASTRMFLILVLRIRATPRFVYSTPSHSPTLTMAASATRPVYKAQAALTKGTRHDTQLFSRLASARPSYSGPLSLTLCGGSCPTPPPPISCVAPSPRLASHSLRPLSRRGAPVVLRD
jgi:hypothetical protein